MIKTNKKIQKNIILSLENVSISYGTFEAVRNVFCNFKKGNITFLLDLQVVVNQLFLDH